MHQTNKLLFHSLIFPLTRMTFITLNVAFDLWVYNPFLAANFNVSEDTQEALSEKSETQHPDEPGHPEVSAHKPQR